MIGIGENAHIAFNDPPANFESKEAYWVVTLDAACRNQQVREGWFESIDTVPTNAISMTPYRIMCCKSIISPVPRAVKAAAVKNTLESEKTDLMIPATLLKTHANFELYTDAESASACSEELRARYSAQWI